MSAGTGSKGSGAVAPGGRPVAGALRSLLGSWLRDTGADPDPGPLLVPLPAAGMCVVAELAHASPVGVHRFGTVALGTGDGALDLDPDPGEVAGALLAELAARTGAEPLPPPDRVDPVPDSHPGGTSRADPVAAVDGVLSRLRRWAGTSPSHELTDGLLVRDLLARVAAGEPGAETERARLAGLARRLAAARDAEPAGPVRELLDGWLGGRHLWRRPVLHPAPWQRITNPLAPAVDPAVADPPVPARAGRFRLRPVRPHGEDLRVLAGWMRRPDVARFFGQPWPDRRWARELAGHGPGSGTAAVFAERADDPTAGPVGYLELYRPARHALARAFPAGPDDLGVHVCVGAPSGRGTGAELLGVVATALLDAEPACPRVLAEPDVRNAAAHGAFRRAGFTEIERIALPHKDAAIVVRHRRAGRR